MKRLALVGFALVLGIGGVLTLVAYTQGSDERARAGQELTEVFVVTEPVTAGRPASEVRSVIKATLIPAELRPETAVTDPDLLDGLVTTADLFPGEQLLTDRFAPPSERTVAGGRVAVPNGMMEASITLTPDRAVGGQVRPGDKVAVVASFDLEDREIFSNLLFHNVLVVNVQSTEGQAVGGDDLNDEFDTRSRQIPGSSLLLTFALTPPQAERLVFSNEYGSIHLTREAPLTPTQDTELVTIGNLFDDQLSLEVLDPQPVSVADGDSEDETASTSPAESPLAATSTEPPVNAADGQSERGQG